MAVSAIFFLDVKGRVIVFRDYRGDVSPKYAEKFMAKINEMEENGKLTPVIYDEGVSYVYLQVSYSSTDTSLSRMNRCTVWTMNAPRSVYQWVSRAGSDAPHKPGRQY